MTFPSAAKGISKIFTAEVLQLITILTASVSVILAAVFATSMNEGSSTAAGVSGTILAVFAIATGVLSLIALILMIIGTIQCAKDKSSFKMIIYLTIINIVVAVIAAIFSNNMFLSNLASAFSDIISFVCSLLVVLGIGNMAAQLGNEAVMAKCGKYFKIVLIVGVLSLLCRFLMIFWASLFAQALIFSFAVIGVVLSIVQYVLYFSLLSNAKKMLATQ